MYNDMDIDHIDQKQSTTNTINFLQIINIVTRIWIYHILHAHQKKTQPDLMEKLEPNGFELSAYNQSSLNLSSTRSNHQSVRFYDFFKIGTTGQRSKKKKQKSALIRWFCSTWIKIFNYHNKMLWPKRHLPSKLVALMTTVDKIKLKNHVYVLGSGIVWLKNMCRDLK